MAINLEKKEKINLEKASDKLKKVKAVLWWKAPNHFPKFDLDVSAFCLQTTPNGPKLLADEYFVFYNNESTPDKSVVKSPDVRDSGSEELVIDIPALPTTVDEISIIVTIHKGDERKQSFGQIEDAGIKIYNEDTGEEICFFDLDEQFSNETAVQVGSFFNPGSGEFSFQAVGTGYKLDLGAFVEGYQ